jgi:uncharacterized membrane protein (UPF0127 family)
MASRRLIHLIVWLVALAVVPGCSDTQSNSGLETIVIGGKTFHLEVAADPDVIQQGLMHREEIAENGGMLFIFPRAEHRSFWMANCLVDIDIIYLDAYGRITAMYSMKARPPRGEDEEVWAYNSRMRQDQYPSFYPAQFAIELKGGTLLNLGLNANDKLDLDLDRLKAMAR